MPHLTSAPESSAPTDPAAPTAFSDFCDIDGFLRIPRLTSLAAGPDGRVVAAIQEADEHGAKLVSSLWELDPGGRQPARRLTFSAQGESSPRFAQDGSLLFSSARPDPQGEAEEDTSAIWRLPRTGEAAVVASAPAGLTLLAVAEDGSMLGATSVLPGGTLEDDAERRTARQDAKRTTIWHTGLPIRQWDHEIGDSSRRLVLVSESGDLTDLTPDVGTVTLNTASADLSPDGATVAASWTQRVGGGETRSSIVLIDTATLRRVVLLQGDDEAQYDSPQFSRDGRHLAVIRSTASSPTDTSYSRLEIHPIGGGEPATAQLGDLSIGEVEWTTDGTLLVAGDLHSSGAILAIDPATGEVRTVAGDGVFSALAPAPDGSLFALRSDIGTPARPLRITAADVAAERSAGAAREQSAPGVLRELPAPGAVAALPGTLEWVQTDVDGVGVGGWLCVPASASAASPAPAMLWIHGGPHGSYNAWSWRWCPWLAVERGYAVLMPDPAMSTGYGDAGLNRGWPRRPDVVFRECETLLDDMLERPELDGTRTAMLGASFGGFMANWIAGHTDRFDAIVTHAGLWALEQQHRTTDAAASKMRVHRHEDEDPDWYRAYSPHRAADSITTPMLVTHGNRDYRVPISEALRLWWDLVSGWDGPPQTMPHRFLQLTSENHWVLTPSNALAWNRAVLAFCDQHVLGGDPIPEVLPW
ncbi:prolyl oligopeptidase family serine peptidase [Brachybacterium fresconis]|uniref:Dipeptidyl aminopeptidase/acylaminoacyl peptidase n=1 Tax=Brachybacterium fresconis TaxID=173363 RepID=A0ABS4YJ46_9MICO|nr:dipeptidyl aminopeptidase/acylaminoacyl peptidase [Brachybacterium fresconis]